MTDKDKKLLTEFLGEGWHEIINRVKSIEYGELCKCTCGAVNCEKDSMHRTFDTWQDLGDLKTELEKKNKWSYFWYFAVQVHDLDAKTKHKYHEDLFIAWLFQPEHFCQLVANSLKGKP